ncbi:MAG: EAL domain-containing protein [Acidobacteria bacterium]|nr:EAL domain-containing protein [Acidobacteriota bacterium]
METQKLTNRYMNAVIAAGFVCLASAVYWLPTAQIDLKFLFLAICTIGFGSRISVQIPKFKSHISVSDTFIFVALVLYGGEAATLLAASEAFCSSWRFCNKKITVFFNAATMALSTTLVWTVLKALGMDTDSELHGHALNDFIVTFSAIATVQFLANTALSSIYGALKSRKGWWDTWKTQYAWTFITYFVGSLTAGVLVFTVDYVGFSALVAAIPIIVFLFLAYRMYLKNVEMSLTQAEQARSHAEILEKQSVALVESEERFRSAFNYAPIGIALVSANGNWLKVNKALCKILGYTENEFLATDFQSMIFVEDLGNTLIKIHELLAEKIPTCQLEQRYLAKNGTTVWTLWSASTVNDTVRDHQNLVFQIQDITDKKVAEEQLHYKATHDGLTGLPNRSLFMARLESAIERAKDNPAHRISILFIDLDRFKVINDSLGHMVGNQLLVGISERLRDCLRPTDMVARLGGDEFTILVEGRYEEKEVLRIAERVHEKFQIPFDLDGREVFSSASIGILNRTDGHTTPEEMMRDADTAMYHAKRAGKSRHEVFDQNMHEAVKEVLQLETDLRRAIERKEFFVHYQPIYSLRSNSFVGVEALARWNHSDLGPIAPTKFIALAEEIGLIDALGMHILKLSCTEMCELRESSPAGSRFSLNVNLSCKQFANPQLVAKIKKVLDETGFPATQLKLEITESVFFEYPEKAIEMLNQLRDLGIDINIDDFGTGYSNLTYLRKLPVSTLKIDRSFISPIDRDGNNSEIVETIAMLARNLSLTVVAEGVETEVQLAALRQLDCEGAQGNYLAPPMSFGDLQYFLNENNVTNIPETKFKDVEIVSMVQ